MEKPGKWFAKTCEKHQNQKEVLSKIDLHLYLICHLSVSAGVNQSHGFSEFGILAPIGLILH